MIVLIDGDILLYKAGFSVESRSYIVTWKEAPDTRLETDPFNSKKEAFAFIKKTFPEPAKVESLEIMTHLDVEPLSHACYNLRNLVTKILKGCSASYDDFKMCVSGKNNFRYAIAKTQPYKGNRSPEDKPHYFQELKEYMYTYYKDQLLEADGEADDLMGIYATTHPEVTIATIDKDLMMIPGINYNIDKGYRQYLDDPGILYMQTTTSNTKILRGYGFKWFCAQMLLGDTADHIPGIRGLGSVKTLTILDKYTTIRSMYAAVIRTYRKHKAIDRLDEIRQLLWIQRKQSFEEVIKK